MSIYETLVITRSLLFSVLALGSCEEELAYQSASDGIYPNGLNAEDAIQIHKFDYSKAYEPIALAFHSTLLDITANTEEFERQVLANASLGGERVSEGGQPGCAEKIRAGIQLGYLLPGESVAFEELRGFLEKLDWTKMDYFYELEDKFEEWRVAKGITIDHCPVTYHASKILQTILTNNQATILASARGVDKRDDGRLCYIGHANYIAARWGLCGSANDDEIADILSEAVRNRLVEEASTRFNDFSRNLATRILTSPGGSLNYIERASLNVLQTTIRDAIDSGIDIAWNWAFCDEQCDNCGPALGIARVIMNCELTGIRAVGSAFEEAERYEYNIDFNNDRVIDDQPVLLGDDPYLAVSGIAFPSGRTQDFWASVDAYCDGRVVNPWAGDDVLVYISSDPSLLTVPTAEVQSPPLTNFYFYRASTQLCFTARNLDRAGYEFIGWGAPGGTPSFSVGPTTRFCTVFNARLPRPGSVYLRFRDPCTGREVNGPGTDFYICPRGYCGL